LVRIGADVRAMIRYSSTGSAGWLERSDLIGEMEIFAGDVRDRDSVSLAMKDTEIVFNLAALIGIPYSYQAPDSYVQTNVIGGLNVFRTALELGVERVIQTSTSEVYGTAKSVPISEEHPLQGQSPYSASKIAADKLAESFHCSFDLPLVTVRPFNTYGPRQSTRAVIPTIMTQLMHGNVIRLGSLTPTRDLNFVSDTVTGFISAASAPAEKVLGEVINVGSGKEISIGDLSKLIVKISGKNVAIECTQDRLRPTGSEVERLLADNAKAKSLMNWQPTVDLESGLTLCLEWYSNPKNLKNFKVDEYSV